MILFLLLAVFTFWPRSASVKNNPMLVEKGSRPLLIAHGGGNLEFPDNTLEAFYNAYSVDKNVKMETDVSITKDGVVILSHDRTLDRKTTLQNAYIHEINYQDLMDNEVDFNYHNPINDEQINVTGEVRKYKSQLFNREVTPLDVTYPEGVEPRHETKFLATTLEELIKAFPNNLINVEIKQSGDLGLRALATVIKLLDDLDAEYNTFARIVLASFHKEVYEQLVHLKNTDYPQLLFSPEESGVITFFLLQTFNLDIFFKDRIAVFQLPDIFLVSNRGFINSAHRNNIAVHYWTINDEETMRKLAKRGADGIMTDLPHLLKQVYDDMYE